MHLKGAVTLGEKMTKITGLRIHITGVVQGVGFRPFVYYI